MLCRGLIGTAGAANAKQAFDIILHVGDLAYAGVNSHGEWEPTWDVYVRRCKRAHTHARV